MFYKIQKNSFQRVSEKKYAHWTTTVMHDTLHDYKEAGHHTSSKRT